jgi:hypothetical protein
MSTRISHVSPGNVIALLERESHDADLTPVSLVQAACAADRDIRFSSA